MSTNKMADTGSHMSSPSQKPDIKLKYTTFTGNGDATVSKSEENISLQEAFKRYRKAKQRDIRKARRLRKRWELRQGDPDKMAALRKKFVAQARKYIGVPYAKKYWPPGSPEYNSKLFLDCCGLVRQVMRDLVEDFGFYIGPWNQAYMYDTLPITVENEKDMKAGDLVFISATYYNTKCKRQRHDMTHVEIWAGDGPKTIGSRWNNGKVQIWDSYRFTAKSYYDETYHFKSIDTWLMGICESHCREHRWKKSIYNPSKKSVFAIEQQDNSQDEAAGDDDDNISDDIAARGPSLPVVCLQQNIPEIKKSNSENSVLTKCLAKKLKAGIPDMATANNEDASNVSEDFTVKGQSLPIICIQQNISEANKTTKPKKKKVGKKGHSKVGVTTKVKKYQTEQQVKTSESQTDGIIFSVKETRDMEAGTDSKDPEKPGSLQGSDKEYVDEESIWNTADKDAADGTVTEQTVQMEMSKMHIGKSDKNSELSSDMFRNDLLPKMNIKLEDVDSGLTAVGTAVSDSKTGEISEDDKIKTKIAWVSLGACPICQTDLNCFDASKPCHIDGATVNDRLFIEEVEGIADTGTQSTVSETCLPFTNLPEEGKTREILGASAKDENHICTCYESSCDDVDIIETNISNNALPKRTTDVNKGSQTVYPGDDNNLPCDECHDVQPSESFQIQQGEIKDDQSAVTSCRNIGKQQSSSKFSGIDPNNPSEPPDDIQGTESAGKKSRGKKSPGGIKKETKLPTCSLPTNMQPTFYVGGGNGVSLVEGTLTGLGWKRTTDKYDERFKLKWVECKSRINYGAFREGEQMVNHLPNSHLLTNKLGLLNSLKEYERVTLSTKGRLPRLKMSEFHPETYKLDEKGDRDLFLEVYKDGEIWICKPIGMNQGKGIFLVRSRDAINQVLEEREQKKLTQQKPGRPLTTRIVQRYIMNPLLLDGRKFDVRAYMLIASTTPYLILFHKGYVRLSCHKYDTNDMSMSTHLTNQFIQKKDPAYKELKEDTAWSMDKFNDYVNEEIRPKSTVEFEEDWVYNTFTKQMQKIMIHSFNSVKHKLQARLGFFDLFGLDFMVDTDMRVWLIEVNTNPALHCNCEALKDVIPGVVEESLFVAIECFEKSKKNLPLMPLQSLKHFTILYCGTRPNTMIPRQSRSVSPMKDNSSTASDKPKPVTTGATSRPSHRLLTQSTPLVAASNQRKSLEKIDSQSLPAQRTEGNFSTKTSVITSAKITLPAIVTKADDPAVKTDRRVAKLDNRTARTELSSTRTELKLAKSDIIVAKTVSQDIVVKSRKGESIETAENKTEDVKDETESKDTDTVNTETESKGTDNKQTEDGNKEVTIIDNKELEERLTDSDIEKNPENAQKEEERRSSLVDTLTRTQNSLNLATSALGRINISLNQVGLTDSLLEEVRLKMTHAEPALGVAKPNSARLQRGRENLDRGN